MNKLKILILSAFILSSCKPSDHTKDNDVQLFAIILTNKELVNNIDSIFKLGDTTHYVFKIIVSRRDRLVRITTYQLYKQVSRQDFPSGYFVYRDNIFLSYDGSELLFNKKVGDSTMNRINKYLTSFSSNTLYHPKVFQFDMLDRKTIKINLPAINPYDLNDDNKADKILFPPNN